MNWFPNASFRLRAGRKDPETGLQAL